MALSAWAAIRPGARLGNRGASQSISIISVYGPQHSCIVSPPFHPSLGHVLNPYLFFRTEKNRISRLSVSKRVDQTRSFL